MSMRCLIPVAFILLTVAASLAEANTRGLTIVARDMASGQPGEVTLYRKTFAVIIGIDRYQNLPPDRQLQNAVKDAKGIEAVLKKYYRFDKIVTLENEEAVKERIMRLLTSELPREMGKDDALFLFWAGHGNQERSDYGDLGYLIPYDGSTDEIYRNITMAEIRDTISKKIPAKHVFYVMDACYSGLLTTRSVDSRPRRDLGYLKEITKESVRQVLTAGGRGEEALDGGPRGHSVFTGRLLEILEGATDYITANELQASIREKVYSDATARNHTQTPGFGTLYGLGDFVFIPQQQDKLGDISAASAARQLELEQLRRLEQDAAAVKAREQQEISRKEAELAALDKQIAEMKERLGTATARSGDGLDQIIALAEQKEEQGRKLDDLRRKREAEERKRQQEIERLKSEAEEKRKAQIRIDLAKYQKVAQNKYAQDLKGPAWEALLSAYPEAKDVPTFDTIELMKTLGLSQYSFNDPASGLEMTESIEMTWKRQEKSYWIYVGGQSIASGTISVFVENDLLVFDPVSKRNFLLKDYVSRDDNRIRPVIVLESPQNVFWRHKEDRYWLYVEGKSISGNVSSFIDNHLLVFDPATQNNYLLEDYRERADNLLRPAKVLESTPAFWRRKEDTFWIYVEGKTLPSGKISSFVENDLLVFDPVAKKSYLLEDYQNRADNLLYPARQLGGSAFWRRKENSYWLYIEGGSIGSRTTSSYAGNDLHVYDPETKKSYLLEDYKNRADNQLRQAALR